MKKKWICNKVKIEHPKWGNFYVLRMNDQLKVWMETNKDVIVKIWVEYPKGIKEIYNIGGKSGDNVSINSKMDIIKLFPKEIQRDFILRDILG